MKFENHSFFKHKNCMDAFICVHSVIQDTGTKTIIRADWMVQGVFGFWFTRMFDKRIFIKDDQYDNWEPYEPRGNLL